MLTGRVSSFDQSWSNLTNIFDPFWVCIMNIKTGKLAEPSQEPGDSPSKAVRQWMAVIAAALAQFLFSGANSALFLGLAHSFAGC